MEIGRKRTKFTFVSSAGKNTTRAKNLILMVKNLSATAERLHLGFENW